LGTNPEPSVIIELEKILNEDINILEAHGLQVHDYGPGRIVGSVHVELPDTLNIVEAHRIIDALEKKVESSMGITLTIHIDPISTDQNKTLRVEQDIKAIVEAVDPNIQINHFRIAQAKGIFVVIFDLVVIDLLLEQEQNNLKGSLKTAIHQRFPHYDVVIDTVLRNHEKA